MKNLKKFGALMLVLVLVMSIAPAVFATPGDADMTGQAGVIGEFTTPDTPTVYEDTITLYKEITAYNPETCVVNAPTIEYTYAIAPGSSGKTITDAYSHHNTINSANVNVQVTTKAGVGTPVITGKTASNSTAGNGKLAITTADQFNASQYGTANRFDIDIDFSGIDYMNTGVGTGAGVYRYKITETCAEATKNAAGIDDGAISNILYMDVYVDGSGDVYGYTLFANDVDISAAANDDAGAASTAGKTEGFVGSRADDGTYTTSETSAADKYFTFNFELTKDVQNDQYAVATNHEFPFTVVLANGTVTANVLPIMTISGNATQTALADHAISQTWNPTIADDAVISYVGIPCGTTVTIHEKNDVVGVTYKSVSDKADTNATEKAINYNEDSNDAIINCTSALTAATENHTNTSSKRVVFTNTLLQISPTGVALRVAPFVLILFFGVGMFIFVAARRRREEEEAA